MVITFRTLTGLAIDFNPTRPSLKAKQIKNKNTNPLFTGVKPDVLALADLDRRGFPFLQHIRV